MGMLFRNSSPNGFYIGNNVISRILLNQNVVWENGPVEPEDDLTKPLTFTATGDSSVQLTKYGSPADISLEYSLDGFKTDPIPYTINTKITLTDGQSVSMRAVDTNDTISTSQVNYYQFAMSGSIAASGNIQSLLDKTCQRMDVPEYCYYRMFYGCSALTQAPALPATTLADSCYNSIFYYCSALTQAPALPATTLANYCYSYMFYGCSKLTQAPAFPAPTLTYGCYQGMFERCSALTTAPELKVTTLRSWCYDGMFRDSGISEFTVDMTECTSVPRLPSSTLFSNAGKPYTVLVPASLYDEWIQATNWSAIADNIKAV